MLSLPYRFKFTSLVKLIKSATFQTYLPLLIIYKHKVIFNPNNLTFFVIPISHFSYPDISLSFNIVQIYHFMYYFTFFIISISHFLYYPNISLFFIIPISHFSVLSQYLTFLYYPNISLSLLSQYLTFFIITIPHFLYYLNI